ncbi:FtsX-like permease family protein [Roseburia hominis]
MLRNSVKQMCRTPVKMILFLLLMMMASLLVTLGVNLFYISERTQEEAKDAFWTVGRVQQKPSAVAREKYWDYLMQDYQYEDVKRYDSRIPETVLDLEGISYIHKPKQYPYYIAHREEYVVRNTKNEVDEAWMGAAGSEVIAEVSPYEDCVPDHPVKLHFKKALFGKVTERMFHFIWYWDYTTPTPEPLYADKTYVISLYRNDGLQYLGVIDKEKYPDVSMVWTPLETIEGLQYRKDGSRIPDEKYPNCYLSEMTENFYETEEGKRWLNLIEGIRITDYSIPVIPTDATKLLPYFYKGDTGITEGRDISEKEYEEGKRVCLITTEFAANNKLKVGDQLPLSLYCSDYQLSAGQSYPVRSYTQGRKIINADGELYQPFFEEEYEVVGIYKINLALDTYTGFEPANNGVIIPAASVTESDENHILLHGPMREYNTVFQLENGTADEFWEIYSRNKIEGLDIRIDDGGYTQVEQSFQNTRKMSVVLLVAGCITAIFILLFFCHMFVTKQKQRTAMERSLGMTKGQCRISLMGALFAIILLGCILGCAAGGKATEIIAGRLEKKAVFSTLFSSNQSVARELPSSAEYLKEGHRNFILPVLSGTVILIAAGVISGVMVEKNLKEEPLGLLTSMKQEK